MKLLAIVLICTIVSVGEICINYDFANLCCKKVRKL